MLKKERFSNRCRLGDAGITLSELLVTMGLMTVVGTIATMFFVSASHSSVATLERGYNVSQARITLDAWTSRLRVADSINEAGSNRGRFVKITPTEIVFYANVNNRDDNGRGRTTRVDLALVSGELVEHDFDSSTGALISTRNFAVNAAPSSASWVFTPYAGASQLPLTENDCLSGASRVAGFCGAFATDGSGTTEGEAQLQSVNRIDVSFTVTDSNNIAPTAFTSTVSITGSRNS